jgi:formylglycine-generating enzyme required for sulfatase activity
MRHVVLAEQGAPEAVRARSEMSGAEVIRRAGPKAGHAERRRVKIVFFAANTSGGERLGLDEEYRAIEQAIRGARYRDAFQLIPKLAVRRSDVQDALLEHSPDVVHFACHGSTRAELLLLDDDSKMAPMSSEALAGLFNVLRDHVALVVFNACFASGQAEAIRRYAGLAVGMRAGIADRAAIAFASGLYGALAYGRSVREGFELGVAAVAAVEPRQKDLPQLFVDEGGNAEATYLVGGRLRRWPEGTSVVGGAVACGLAALGWLGLQPGHEELRQPAPIRLAPIRPAPIRGMVRFAAAEVRPGVFDAARRPQVCSALEATEDCAELAHPEPVAAVHVAAFDLDVHEVTNRDFADWLNANDQLWRAEKYGIIETQREPVVPLGLTSEDCFEALTVTSDRRVVVSPDKARWPAVCVTWHGADIYCRAHDKRLPLAVEWELAAKGAEGRPFPWGGDVPRQDGVAFDLLDGAAPHPRDVGNSPQDVSPEGIYDLGGNVAEWVEWVEDGRGGIDTRTIRGGSWGSRGACHLLGSGCKHIGAGEFSSDVGFRCASSVIDGD